MRKLTKEFFDNKAEQNKIKSAIHEAIPEGIFYHNLVIVLSEIIKDMVWEMTKEDVFLKSHRKAQHSEELPLCTCFTRPTHTTLITDPNCPIHGSTSH